MPTKEGKANPSLLPLLNSRMGMHIYGLALQLGLLSIRKMEPRS
ncbi:MAG: hypothetical protein O9346_13620 [Leptospiraceae bacterium]|nr:hypothetical protein [Leptospiraceae bacterium]